MSCQTYLIVFIPSPCDDDNASSAWTVRHLQVADQKQQELGKKEPKEAVRTPKLSLTSEEAVRTTSASKILDCFFFPCIFVPL